MLRARDIARLTSEARTLLAGIEDCAGELARRANSDSNGFVPSGGEGWQAPTYADDGSRPGPVPGMATGKPDRVDLAAKHLLVSLQQVLDASKAAIRDGQSLLAIPAGRADELAKEAKPMRSATCANPNCGCWVSNTASDRLRAGRCEPCWKYRQRNGGAERPRKLCHPEPEQEAG